ncbi:DNA topoisomerase 1 isoform X2 [Austrofundulus limnaeus]|uniref:DNA topoisomerase 1 isoform X2 n=1 Tax=Austrofundulus limnaeus TaxID=52670 RepID=A0A2I4D971_AUSLI|nr:PREDICTED: DNA topoisomerase 1-like isoform X2 [Austrofundulus limnaeus]
MSSTDSAESSTDSAESSTDSAESSTDSAESSTDSALSESSTDMMSESSTDSALSESSTDSALSESSTDSALSESSTDSALSESSTDSALSESSTDSALSESSTDSALSESSTDSALSESSTEQSASSTEQSASSTEQSASSTDRMSADDTALDILKDLNKLWKKVESVQDRRAVFDEQHLNCLSSVKSLMREGGKLIKPTEKLFSQFNKVQKKIQRHEKGELSKKIDIKTLKKKKETLVKQLAKIKKKIMTINPELAGEFTKLVAVDRRGFSEEELGIYDDICNHLRTYMDIDKKYVDFVTGDIYNDLSKDKKRILKRAVNLAERWLIYLQKLKNFYDVNMSGEHAPEMTVEEYLRRQEERDHYRRELYK